MNSKKMLKARCEFLEMRLEALNKIDEKSLKKSKGKSNANQIVRCREEFDKKRKACAAFIAKNPDKYLNTNSSFDLDEEIDIKKVLAEKKYNDDLLMDNGEILRSI